MHGSLERWRATDGTGGETLGILAAVLSSSLGGSNTVLTRFAVGATDPVTLAALRFGLGFLLLLPVALALGCRWPRGRDWLATAALGVLFFGLFMSLFNLALRDTTAARGALALSTLPLVTMLAAAALGVERLGRRKAAGVLLAVGGVAVALAADLDSAPPGAWRGDGTMVAATLCFALYSLWARPAIARSSPLAFVTAGMAAGSLLLGLFAAAEGRFDSLASFGPEQWAAIAYLGSFGAALTFFLWVFALAHTTPTRVANTITLNPLLAALVGALLLGEPIGPALAVGLAAVAVGILLAATAARSRRI
jgi:drug/metabolite transporter (DMT)-like permease